jgi:hypothetical protein
MNPRLTQGSIPDLSLPVNGLEESRLRPDVGFIYDLVLTLPQCQGGCL